MVVVTISASYRLHAFGASTFLKEIPLFSVGRNIDPGNGAPSPVPNGCFFIAGSDVREPYIRHEHSGFSHDYDIQLTVRQTKTLNPNGLSTLTTALNLFSGLNPTDFSGGKAIAVQTATSYLQSAIGQIFNHSGTSTLKASIASIDPHKDVYRIVDKGGTVVGDVVVYGRLSASIVLDKAKSVLSPDDVLGDAEVGGARCISSVSGGPPCTTSLRPFWSAVNATGKTDSGNVQRSFFEKPYGVDVLRMCETIRDVAKDDLALSKLDELIVRWAALEKGGLYGVLQDTGKRSQLLADFNKAAAAKAPKDTAPVSYESADLDRCWNKADETLLRGIGKQMNIKFQ